jgi:uncharacterized protein involved in exopolysaccharide biosynthesis
MQEALRGILDEARRAWPFRWLAWIVAVAIAAIGSVTTLLLPDIYTSTAQVAILQSGDQAVLAVHNAELRFLNDATLEAVLSQVDLGMDLTSASARQRAKDSLKSRITLLGKDTELFAIRCGDRNPQRAKAVCDVVLAAFKISVADNSNTSQLEQQLVGLQAALSVAEKRLQEYRIAHLDIFGQGGIEARLDAARAAEEKATSDYDAAGRRRDEFQRVWRAARADPSVTAAASLAAPAGDPLIDRLYAAWTELEGLRTRFSETHPDVILARRQIESVVRQYPPDVRMCTRNGPDSADSLQSSSALDKSEEPLDIDRVTVDATAANIAACRALSILAQAESEVDNLSALNASAPPIQAELNRLTAERNAALDHVENARSRIQDLGVGDPASLYTVVGEPVVAHAPSSPNRPLWLAVVLIGALAGGGGAAYGRGFLAGTFVGPTGVRRAYTLPFYGAVSLVNGLRTRLEQSTQLVTFALAIGAIIAGMLLLILADPYISIAREWAVGASISIQHLAGITR